MSKPNAVIVEDGLQRAMNGSYSRQIKTYSLAFQR